MMYAVFILRNGEWQMHETFHSLSAAQRELDYLTKTLGVTAKLFQKTV